jgi:hypothetical protein
MFVVVSNVRWGISADPKDPRVTYFNDTDVDVLVRECSSTCMETIYTYRIEAHGVTEYNSGPDHAEPDWLRVEAVDGTLLGCAPVLAIGRTINSIARISEVVPCPSGLAASWDPTGTPTVQTRSASQFSLLSSVIHRPHVASI